MPPPFTPEGRPGACAHLLPRPYQASPVERRIAVPLPTLPAILVGLPLRCLRSFGFLLRPACSSRRSDWLRVPRCTPDILRPYLRTRRRGATGHRASLLAALSRRFGCCRRRQAGRQTTCVKWALRRGRTSHRPGYLQVSRHTFDEGERGDRPLAPGSQGKPHARPDRRRS